MLPDATALRIHVYDRLLDSGRPPTLRELAERYRVPESDARRALAEMKIGKTVLVHPRSGEIWMAGPFAAAETPYKVVGQRARWFANCAWDMLGVAVLVKELVRIETSCTDCGDPWHLDVEPARPFPHEGVVHFLVPARRWYDDIGYT